MSLSNELSTGQEVSLWRDDATADLSFEIDRHVWSRVADFRNDLARLNSSRLLPTAPEFGRCGELDLAISPRSNLSEEPSVPQFARRQTPPTPSFVVSILKWEGIVTEVEKEAFTARLREVSAAGTEEDAEFAVSEISRDDLSLLEPGACFYWSIGYQTDLTGRQRTVSELRFRRVPGWAPEEYNEAELEGKRIASLLGAVQRRP